MDRIVDELLQHFTIEEIIGLLKVVLRISLIIFISVIISKVLRVAIKKVILSHNIHPAQGKTMVSILQSMIKYVISFISGMMILMVLDIDITPILTSAGIAGFAIGFGSQNLVRDILSGFFIIFEGQFHVGDFVEVNGGKIRGTVEEIGLRVTKIREWSMKLNYVPNGEIQLVNNYSRGKMRPIVDVTVPYHEDIQYVTHVLQRVCENVTKSHKDILVEGPSILGITDIQEKGITFTILAVTLPDSYWYIGREIRKTILNEFSNSGVKVAYPHRVLVEGEYHGKFKENLSNNKV